MSVLAKRHSPGIVMALVCVVFLMPFEIINAQDAAKPPVTKHEIEGRGDCLMCHGGAMPNIKAVPATHEGRPNETCSWCHDKDAKMQTVTPKATPHVLQGREACLMCHGGTMPAPMKAVPESHEGRESNTCAWCHVPKPPA